MCGVCGGQSDTETDFFFPNTSECRSQSPCLLSAVGTAGRITKGFRPTTLKIGM
jgi:hypothetical protein